MNYTGVKLIENFIKDAKAWERAGIYKKSEAKYIKALRIYDSCLLYPWGNKIIVKNLTGSIAKFSLASSIKNPCFDAATAVFLSMDDNDAETALLWLEKLLNTREISAKNQEILTRFADIYLDNHDIVILLAEIFINLNRCDFSARKIYRKVLTFSDLDSEKRIMVQEYLSRENKKGKGREDVKLLGDSLSEHSIPKMENLPKEVISSDSQSFPILRSGLNILIITWEKCINIVLILFKKLFKLLAWLFKSLYMLLSKFAVFLREREKVRLALKWGISAIVCTGLIILMVNTFFRLFPEKIKKPHHENIQKIISVEHVSKRAPALFTIQVAAYLKKQYGQAYVSKLKAEGLDAYLSKVEGGGKTWFLVRISQFPDKKTASAYGRKLKKQGYIEDFFVDNNTRRQR